MTKRPTTRTPREPLSITGKPIPKEVDYDLLGDLDDEEQGQIRPFMDPTGNPLASSKAEPYQQQGLQQETLRYMGNLMEQAKSKGPVPPLKSKTT